MKQLSKLISATGFWTTFMAILTTVSVFLGRFFKRDVDLDLILVGAGIGASIGFMAGLGAMFHKLISRQKALIILIFGALLVNAVWLTLAFYDGNIGGGYLDKVGLAMLLLALFVPCLVYLGFCGYRTGTIWLQKNS